MTSKTWNEELRSAHLSAIESAAAVEQAAKDIAYRLQRGQYHDTQTPFNEMSKAQTALEDNLEFLKQHHPFNPEKEFG